MVAWQQLKARLPVSGLHHSMGAAIRQAVCSLHQAVL